MLPCPLRSAGLAHAGEQIGTRGSTPELSSCHARDVRSKFFVSPRIIAAGGGAAREVRGPIRTARPPPRLR